MMDEPSERQFCCSVLELVERTTLSIQEEFIGAISERRRELIQLCLDVFECILLLETLSPAYEDLVQEMRVLANAMSTVQDQENVSFWCFREDVHE